MLQKFGINLEKGTNHMKTLNLYKEGDTWYFDDESKQVKHEPFVMGISEMITEMVGEKKKAKVEFSSEEFEDKQFSLEWLMPENGGNWYGCKELGMAGWLCPVLYKYFDDAPKSLFLRFE